MFDRCYSFSLPTGQGPQAFSRNLNLSDEHTRRYLEAWISNFGSSNVHILSGQLTTAQCQQELVAAGLVDLVMTVTSAGPSRVRLPDDASTITVFFEAVNSSGQAEVVTVRVYDPESAAQ